MGITSVLKYFTIVGIFIFSFTSITKADNRNIENITPDSIDYVSGLNNYLIKSINEKRYLNEALSIVELILSEDLFDNDDTKALRKFQQQFTEQDFQSLLMLDSLTKFDIIPPRVIRALSNYVYVTYLEPDSGFTPFTYDCEFPAKELYNGIWNTVHPNPYTGKLADSDSLITIRLVNDSSDFHIPGEGRVSSRYGWRNGRFHAGTDLAVYHGLPIYATFPGVVRLARSYGGYGRLVVIRHDNGLETFYAHLSRIRVNPGQRVKPGDVIGNSGNSGRSFGTHLHFEVRYRGIPLNPAHIICFNNNELKHHEVILKRNNHNYFVYSEDAILYRVKRGDYLFRIAEEFGTTVARICETNDIRRNQTLRVGQIIKIYL